MSTERASQYPSPSPSAADHISSRVPYTPLLPSNSYPPDVLHFTTPLPPSSSSNTSFTKRGSPRTAPDLESTAVSVRCEQGSYEQDVISTSHRSTSSASSSRSSSMSSSQQHSIQRNNSSDARQQQQQQQHTYVNEVHDDGCDLSSHLTERASSNNLCEHYDEMEKGSPKESSYLEAVKEHHPHVSNSSYCCCITLTLGSCKRSATSLSATSSNADRISVCRRCARVLWQCLLHPQVVKCALAFLYLSTVMLVLSHLLVVVHQRSPTLKSWGVVPRPLPDLVLDNVTRRPWGFTVAEVLIRVLTTTTFVLLFFHQHGLVVLRRLFCIMAAVFAIRAVCVVSTSLTNSSEHLMKACPPLHITSAGEFIQRALKIFVGFGMRLQGGETCGDFVYSGHTCTLTIFNLIVIMYAPDRRMFLLLKIATCLMNIFGVVSILLAHEHYTVDVVLAVVISVLVFNEYHNVVHLLAPANGATPTSTSTKHHHSWRLILSSPITYLMERNGEGRLINRLRIPCWPSRLRSVCVQLRHKYHFTKPNQYRKSSVDQQHNSILPK